MFDDIPEGQPLAADIPLTTAWVDGRRIYIICAKDSPLGEALYGMGAKWDKVVQARYVGTQRRSIVEPLIREHLASKAATAKLRESSATSGHFLAIPYKASTIREDAKRAGAAWVAESKQRAFPDAETLATFQGRVSKWERSNAGASRGHKRDECGRSGATHAATESSGIAGTVCHSCARQPSYTLSFA